MSQYQTVRESKRGRRASIQPLKPLANLPHDLLENVFSFLPIREAIEASMVSTRFKKSWHLNRKFNFGKDFSLRFSREDLIAVVDGLFNSHRGEHIQTFQLQIDPLGAEEFLDKWLEICIQKGIEELDLYFFQSGYSLSADFVDNLKALRTLKLVHCDFQLPPVMNSMRFLSTLVLWQLNLTEDKLDTLIRYCKLLATLDLFRCSGIRHASICASSHRFFKLLKITCCSDLRGIMVEAPSLRSIFYYGHIPTIKFGSRVALHEAFFNFEPSGYRTYLQAPLLEQLTSDICNVTLLSTSALLPEGLTARHRGSDFREADYCFLNLREFQLFMEGGLFCNPYDIIMFIKHCPKLEKLFIDLNDYNLECGAYWELHQKPRLEKLHHYFNKLRVVKLNGFKFLRSELELVKILLQRAISLELLVLVTPKNGRTKLRSQDAPKYNLLFLTWKASPATKIVLYEHFNDKSCITPSHPKSWF
ncbi:hypothetical protein VNO77_22062 [Canavalia gladiata]|uniref:F-box domain-containing protein n=1 Tax=Canavalia gladiata TaxID=3824 RepID=A0AAN9L731_CANGL